MAEFPLNAPAAIPRTPDDSVLLVQFLENNSDAAFAELIRRHLNLVYSVALRQVGGNAHLAEDVTQLVFAALARKASTLRNRASLGGWLYRSAHFAASDVVRAERRRRTREQEAHLMDSILTTAGDTPDWDKLRPVLDAAIADLDERDREAVALRFFEGHSLAVVGASLRVSENAARMRIDRALDKLHGALVRRGVTSTSAALGLALTQQAGVAAPAGLGASVTSAVLAGTSATLGIGHAVIFMSMTKLQIGLAVAIATGGAAVIVSQNRSNADLEREIAALRTQSDALVALRAENRQLASAAAEVARLRGNDGELAQLALETEEVKQRHASAARAAQANQLQRRRQQLTAQIQEMDRRATEEVDRMNREGNAFVNDYKALMAQSKDAALAAPLRDEASAAAKRKMEAVQQKQREIQTFIKATQEALTNSPAMAELRSLGPEPGEVGVSEKKAGWFRSSPSGGRLELRNAGVPPAAAPVSVPQPQALNPPHGTP